VKLAVALALVAALPSAAPPRLHVTTFADTGIPLTDVLWTGSEFLYVENTTNAVWAAGPAGVPLRPFASMPRLVEETRCRRSPGAHGFAPRDIYCHAPDNVVYRISPDGAQVTVFARLPEQGRSDGALAFDTVGRFGYALLAAGGQSGAPEPAGGTVYAIDATGGVRRVGAYPGPGGADEAAVVPARFGSAPGQLMLTVDAGPRGTLVLMDAAGRTRTIARLPDGPNPIAVVRKRPARPRASPPPGLYLTDTASHHVFFTPAAGLARYAGAVIVASELKALFWVVRPRGNGFQTLQIPTDLPAGVPYNLEGATYVAG
jgi:hypothetical protein